MGHKFERSEGNGVAYGVGKRGGMTEGGMCICTRRRQLLGEGGGSFDFENASLVSRVVELLGRCR